MSRLSGYRMMWMLVMFDLPVLTAVERKEATMFREFLLDLGFERCQLSVYARFCPGKEKTEVYLRQIRAELPEGGQVDILFFTDKQYENIVSFEGRKRKKRKNPEQYSLF